MDMTTSAKRPTYRPQAAQFTLREKLFEAGAHQQPHQHQHQLPRRPPPPPFPTRHAERQPASPSSPSSSLSSAAPSPTSSTSSSRSSRSPTSSAATSPTASSHGGDDSPPTSLAAAQRQIEELQSQVCTLNKRATTAVQKWADYEDELARLRKQLKATNSNSNSNSTSNSTSTSTSSSTNSTPQRMTFLSAATPAAAASRISAIWSSRSTPNLKPAAAASPTPPPPLAPGGVDKTTDDLLVALTREQQLRVTGDRTLDDLVVALTREQQLRAEAEARERDAGREVEELSASLFEQANEMVAAERRARALLEQRVHLLEQRDREKRRRLERLELAVGRIERVKKLLQET